MKITTRRSSHGGPTARGTGLASRTALAAAATLLCGVFGLGVVALSSAPSAAAATATIFVDNVNGTATLPCGATSGSGACKMFQDGVNAAEALSSTDVTLNVAGSSTAYNESVTINLPSGSGPGEGDTLDIEGTGSTLPTLDNGGTRSNVTIPTTSAGAVTIGHMTISGGSKPTRDGSGGAIDDRGDGTLTVNNDTFSNNQADAQGGAIDAADKCTSASGTGNLVGDRLHLRGQLRCRPGRWGDRLRRLQRDGHAHSERQHVHGQRRWQQQWIWWSDRGLVHRHRHQQHLFGKHRRARCRGGW